MTALSPSHAKDLLSLIITVHAERIMPSDHLQDLVRQAECAGLAYYHGEELTLCPRLLRELVKATSLIAADLMPRADQPFYWHQFKHLEKEFEVSYN